MDTIFMNSKNSRTSEYHVLVLNKLDIRRCCFIKSIYLLPLAKPKNTYSNNSFNVSAPTWSE